MGKLIKASKMSEKVHFLLGGGGGGGVHSLIGSSKGGEKPDLNRLDSSATETNLSPSSGVFGRSFQASADN